MNYNINQKIGRWEIISLPYEKLSTNQCHNYICYLCRCECGTVKSVYKYNLDKNSSLSCGCLHKEVVTFHGQWKTKLYHVWSSMKSRCLNKNKSGFKDYGNRGICVCEEWNKNFMSFYNWSKANGYKEKLHLDRINNDGDYEPNNCRWADNKTNAQNKRSNIVIEAFNKKKCLSEWCRDEKCVVGYNTLRERIVVAKMDAELAITTPSGIINKAKINSRNVIVNAFGKNKNLMEWSKDKDCVVNYNTLRNRIVVYKWQPEKAITTKVKTA